MTAVLRIDDLHKTYNNQLEVLQGIDLSVTQGETIAIIGASGSGKSTLLRCLNFLELPSAGRIYLHGRAIGGERRDRRGHTYIDYTEAELCKVRTQIGMVFQHFNLFPHMTALQNVMEGPRTVLNLSRQDAERRARQQLDKVGLAAKAHEYPARLSGGQQQRVAIARALAMNPAVMLFDEATSALDPELVGEVLQTIRALSQEGMTLLIVTHEIGFAYAVADRVLFLHQGLIYEQGPPEQVLLHPQQPRTREFLAGFSQFSLPDKATES